MNSSSTRSGKRPSAGGKGPGAVKKNIKKAKLQTRLIQEADDESTREVSLLDEAMPTDYSLSGDGDKAVLNDNEAIKEYLRRIIGTVDELKFQVDAVEKRINAVEKNQVPLTLAAGRHRSTISSVTHIAPAVTKKQKVVILNQMKKFYRNNAFAGMKFIDTDDKGIHAWDVAEKQTIVPTLDKEKFPVTDRIEWVKSTFTAIRNATQTACRNNYMSKVTCYVCCDLLVLLTTKDLTNTFPVCFEYICFRWQQNRTHFHEFEGTHQGISRC